jgi:hypothetical protein
MARRVRRDIPLVKDILGMPPAIDLGQAGLSENARNGAIAWCEEPRGNLSELSP